MARTEEGAALTEAQRQGQQQIRAQTLSLFALVWPLWTGDEGSFLRMVTVTLPIVRANRALSASLAASYFREFRAAEGISGTATPILAEPLPDDIVAGTLHRTGLEMTGKALNAGQSPEQARETALVRTSGTVTRLVLDGGRDTLVRSAGEDKEAGGGWARVTDGDPCAFCALLASRGPVYSADTADFEAHDHCTCTAEPHYDGSEWPGRAREFRDLYDQAIREAKADGTLKRGTSNDSLNAFRRALARQ